ncbi:MAG TPA: metallophosphoesterase family protein [Ktedonobacteraceae bacterium]|nr:metallophosphoesterase family protein [Ktedonobacteraceae bacterium]
MQLAIISDIHGNCFALDYVLEDIRRQGIEEIVCLGDAIQGGAQPAETVQRLRALGCPVVMGNADDWLLTGQETSPHEQVSEQQLAVRDWSLAQLTNEDLAYMRGFQPTIEISLEAGKRLLCFHGSPHSYNDILLPDTPEETFRQLLGGFDATLFTGGHTHTQQLRRLGDAWYFNPGSVALAYNWELSEEGLQVDPWADYAIVTSEDARFGITFRHVPFDVVELSRIIRASGRPYAEQIVALYQREA